MKNYEINTAETYEDMVDFVAERSTIKVKVGLGDFIDEDEQDFKPAVKQKAVDPEFPEQWQTIYVNIISEDDLSDFVKQSGLIVGPRTSEIIYQADDSSSGLLNFFGE